MVILPYRSSICYHCVTYDVSYVCVCVLGMDGLREKLRKSPELDDFTSYAISVVLFQWNYLSSYSSAHHFYISPVLQILCITDCWFLLRTFLVDCDHIGQRKVEMVHDRNRIVQCLGYLHAEADPDRIIL